MNNRERRISMLFRKYNIRERKLSKQEWCCVIAIEILLMNIAYFIYGNRGTVELSFTQDDLLYESGENGFYLDKLCDHNYMSVPNFC